MKTILNDTSNEIVIKNSRFITLLFRINEDSNISNILDKVEKDYPKATHYCYGYILEDFKKSSDDGEPGGTAGIPILSTLEKEGMINVLAVVVRYFGGVKLGAGGLVRAYTKSVKEAISNSQLINLVEGYKIEISFSYDKQKEIDYLLKDYEIVNKEYLEKIDYTVLIPVSDIDILDNYDYTIINNLLIKKQKI